MAEKKTNGTSTRNGGDLGFEAELFTTADKLHGNNISDSFEAKQAAEVLP
jgi:hypothetical protein